MLEVPHGYAGPTAEISVLFVQLFKFSGSSPIRTAHKVPEIRSSSTAVQVKTVLRAALLVPVSMVTMFHGRTHIRSNKVQFPS